MKKLLLTLALAGSVTGALAQGTISYNNRIGGVVDARFFAANPNNLSESKVGNIATGNSDAGTQTYAGARLFGSQYTIQLWSGVANTAADALTLVPNSNRSLRTSTATGTHGLIETSTGPEIEIPGVLLGGSAALQIRVWDNMGGTLTSWAQVLDPLNAGVYRGASPVWNSEALGGGTTPAGSMRGLQSFNVYVVPEPSTFVLAGLGAAALMIIRRRK